MSRREHRRTPRVTSGRLYTDDEHNGIRLDEPAWWAWLRLGFTFYYDSPLGCFTAHSERRRRGGCYWVAYRRRAGTLHRVYLGKSEALSRQRLDEVALILNSDPPQE